jgi:hypothetical protein
MRLVGGQRMVQGQAKGAEKGTGAEPPEGYLERVAKYVPVEIVAAFMALRAVLPIHGSPGALPTGLELALYAGLLVLTPLYYLKFGGDVPEKPKQVAVTTVSFVVWSYAIGGPFFWGTLQDTIGHVIVYPALAAALLVMWSLVAGLVDPRTPPPSPSPPAPAPVPNT